MSAFLIRDMVSIKLSQTRTMCAFKNTSDVVAKIALYFYFLYKNQIVANKPYSHSIVAGGLLDTSYVTREMPSISLMMRPLTVSSSS